MTNPPDRSSDEEPKPPTGREGPEQPPAEVEPREFFVVGVGASAGGLEAISELLRPLRRDAGFSVLVVQHLGPQHESLLVELLARVSSLPVSWAEHGKAIEPGRVYVAPAKATLAIRSGVLLLEENGRKHSGAINHMLKSLAEAAKDHAIGIVLSGTGADGVEGAKAIKAAGGVVFAQNETASFHDMPRAVIEAGCADRVLSPAGMAEELLRLTQTTRVLWGRLGGPEDKEPAGPDAESYAAILRLLALRTGVDFSEYKSSTIRRRLARRMVLARTPEPGDYLKLVQRDLEELGRLFESLLINVTEFFRDPEYFEFLAQEIIPEIISHHADSSPIRAWVPGCSTGEEAFSLAMLLREKMEESGNILPVQIFGTDANEEAIAAARAGLFSVADVSRMGPERLRRFFIKTERGYFIQKPIRDMCIFARQNVVRDSPFSRLDLLSCRNLLIYFDAKLQRKLMPTFHYALNPGGFLVLGSSESVGVFADLFRLIDRRYRIYARKITGRRPSFDLMLERNPTRAAPEPKKISPAMAEEPNSYDIIREADRIVLSRQGPTGVLVTEDLEIIQFRGDVSPYLAPGEGRASLNLLKMARDGLAPQLTGMIEEARKKRIRVRRPGVVLTEGRKTQPVDIDVTPIDSVPTKERFYLVMFAPLTGAGPRREKPGKEPKTGKKPGQDGQLEQLRQDLDATRTYLQATIERHESTNQELRAANEEIQSSNEELQSTNEELETAKEELQSTNEELTTVNEELHSRQLELIQLNNDLHNLINSVHIPIVILGQDMRIRRFSPRAEKVLNIIPSDLGRPITDLNLNLNLNLNLFPDLMQEVLDTLTVKECEVQDKAGRWYSMRVRPYKTAENKIEGIVIALIDIEDLKRSAAELEELRKFADAVFESVADPMVALDAELRIKQANRSFYRVFKTSRERAEGVSFFEAVNEPEKPGVLRKALEGIIPTHISLTNHEVQIDLPGTGPTKFVINVHQITSGARAYPLILLSLRPL